MDLFTSIFAVLVGIGAYYLGNVISEVTKRADALMKKADEYYSAPRLVEIQSPSAASVETQVEQVEKTCTTSETQTEDEDRKCNVCNETMTGRLVFNLECGHPLHLACAVPENKDTPPVKKCRTCNREYKTMKASPYKMESSEIPNSMVDDHPYHQSEFARGALMREMNVLTQKAEIASLKNKQKHLELQLKKTKEELKAAQPPTYDGRSESAEEEAPEPTNTCDETPDGDEKQNVMVCRVSNGKIEPIGTTCTKHARMLSALLSSDDD